MNSFRLLLLRDEFWQNLAMKKLSLVLALALSVGSTLSSLGVAASPKTGAPCSKANQVLPSGGYSFTCLKSGKKLLWSKGVKVVSPTPAPAPSTTPSPTSIPAQTPTVSATPTPTPRASTTPTPTQSPTQPPFKALIPISLPIAQNGSITFSNILDHISEIPQIAYQNVQNVINANSPVTVETSVFVGPTTILDVAGGASRITDIVAREARLWSGFSQSPYYAIYAYNAADEPTTESRFLSDMKIRGYDLSTPEFSAGPIRAMAGNCQQAIVPGQFSGPLSRCGGANSGSYTNSNDSFLELGETGDSQDFYFTDGGIIGHEYMHAVAAAQWIGVSNCHNAADGRGCFRSGMSNVRFSPCWLNEGLPNSVGPIVSSRTLSDYQTYRRQLPYNQGPTTVTDYSQQSLQDYLFNQSPSSCYQNMPVYRLGYSVGAITTEALVAIGGPQAVMAIYAKGAEGEDFATAFQSVYGISWSEASTILSKLLAAEYATFGPAPK